MKIAFVTPSFYPAVSWGGPIKSTYDLCNNLSMIPNTDLCVITSDSTGPKMKNRLNVSQFPLISEKGYPIYFCKKSFGISGSLEMLGVLVKKIKQCDVVHLTACYSFPSIPTILISRFFKKKILWSPRGSFLSELDKPLSLKKFIWKLFCRLLIKKKDLVFHVTSEAESNLPFPFKNFQFVKIVNGIDLKDIKHKVVYDKTQLKLIFIGRIHPSKNLESLIFAMKPFKKSKISLTIVGEGEEGYKKKLTILIKENNLDNLISFEGFLNRNDVNQQIIEHDALVLVSHSENFGMVVLESLASGIPAITSVGTPWQELEQLGIGFTVEKDSTSIATAIKRLKSADLKKMGLLGRNYVAKKYNIKKVASDFHYVLSKLSSSSG